MGYVILPSLFAKSLGLDANMHADVEHTDWQHNSSGSGVPTSNGSRGGGAVDNSGSLSDQRSPNVRGGSVPQIPDPVDMLIDLHDPDPDEFDLDPVEHLAPVQDTGEVEAEHEPPISDYIDAAGNEEDYERFEQEQKKDVTELDLQQSQATNHVILMEQRQYFSSQSIPTATTPYVMKTPKLPDSQRLKIMITGGAGFVGSHLVDKLMQEGHEVIVVDNFFTGQKKNIEHWLHHPNFR